LKINPPLFPKIQKALPKLCDTKNIAFFIPKIKCLILGT